MYYAHGPLDSKFWIISAFPTNKEIEGGMLFRDNVGSLLTDQLEEYPGLIDEIRFDCLIDEQSQNNTFVYFKAQRYQDLLRSVEDLKRRIRDAKPNLVLLVGAEAALTLVDSADVKDLSKWRGHILWSTSLNCKVLCTYSPGQCIRQRYVSKKLHPGQYEALFCSDMKKAVEESKSSELQHAKYTTLTNPTFAEAYRELNRMLKESTIVSYDIETLPPYTAHFIDCIGFSDSPERACCIPLYRPTEAGPVAYYEPHEQLEIFKLIKQLMESDIPKVAQNSQFDTGVLDVYYGIKVCNLVHDTMLAAHNLYADLPKDLGTSISMYTKLPYQKFLVGTGKLRDRWEYCATDALANIHVMNGQIQEMKELGILSHFRTITMPAVKVLLDMQIEGIKVDLPARDKVLKQQLAVKEQLLFCLDEALPLYINTNKKFLHKFNPTSWKQRQLLFYTGLDCKKVYKKGKITTDRTAMETIQSRDKRPYVKTLIDACLRYKDADYLASRLRTGLIDGRMHSAYGLGGLDPQGEDIGTDTGRLNSRASDLLVVKDSNSGKYEKSGTNMQNVSPGIQRQMFVPDEGEGFCYTDLYGAESYTTAVDAKEVKMVKMLENDEKIHDWMLEVTIEKFPEECASVGYGYKLAKHTVHGLNYGVEPPMMSLQWGLPLYVCEWQYNHYHSTFPGIKHRMLLIEKQLLRNRTIVSMLGRKRFFAAPNSPDLLKLAYAWPNQSCIAEVTIKAMCRLYYWGKWALRHPEKENLTWVAPKINTHDGLLTSYILGEEVLVHQMIKNAFDVPLERHGLKVTVPVTIAWPKNFDDVADSEVIRYS